MLRNRTDIVRKLCPIRTASLLDIAKVLPEPRVAVGIDGSMDYDEVLEMLLFYVAAGGYRCRFTVDEDRVDFDLLNSERTEELFASAAVPLWEEDLLNLVQTSEQIETEVDFRATMERIPFALMTMAELYLAWKVTANGEIRILFLDRPFSGTYPSLYRDAALMLRGRTVALEGLSTPQGPVERFDLHSASVFGSSLTYVPPRGFYLPYAALRFMIRNPNVPKKELAESFALTPKRFNSLMKRLQDLDEKAGRRLILREDVESIEISSERLSASWRKVRALALGIAERIFNPNDEWNHPLIMDNGRWLSVRELNALNLFLLEALIEEALKHQVLVVGIAKDTTATDFTRAALPTSFTLRDDKVALPGLKSDKALLTIVSTANSVSLPTPWRTFAYDGCMATLIATPDEKTKLRAARKTITREKLFVRCYFQLRSFQHDPEIRAPVFLYDRLFQSDHDNGFEQDVMAVEYKRKVKLHIFLETEEKRSQLDDLVLLILSACDNPEVLEAYGHNQLLYLADKLVKGEVQLMKGLLRGVVDLELTPLARREKVFSIARRFRDLRAESESARRQSAQSSEVRTR